MNINSKILKLVSALCAALLIIIMLEWIIAKFSESRLLSSIESPAPANVPIDQVPEVDLEAKTEDSYVDMVARPLFLKGRKPIEESSAEKDKEQTESESFDWRLDGIYTGKNGLSALLSRNKEGNTAPVAAGSVPPAVGGTVAGSKDKPDKYRRVSVNEDLDGWRLTQIKTDRVVFELGGESKELVLRKPKPKELPPEQNKSPDQQQNRNSNRPQARTKDMGKIQDEAIRRRLNRQQSLDDSESEPAPPVDESENGENEQ